ncbi:MAG TPA: hypothetical protein VI653_11530 [Steroidobacteraceae bacterium]
MKCARAVGLMEPLRNEFASRYYDWCLEESAREQRAGFPNIRAIPSYVSLLFLEFAASCDEREIRNLMIAGIKTWQPRAVATGRLPLSAAEDAAQGRFKDYSTEQIPDAEQPLQVMRVSRREREIREQERLGRTTTLITAKQWRGVLCEHLNPLLGIAERTRTGIEYVTKIGPWFVQTSLDWAGGAQLNYAHWITPRRRLDACPTQLVNSIGPMSWWGIQRDTTFDLVQRHELDSSARALAGFCRRVLDALPRLLDGLEHCLPEAMEDGPQMPLRRRLVYLDAPRR